MKRLLGIALICLALPAYAANTPPPASSQTGDIIINGGNGQYGSQGNTVRNVTSGLSDTTTKDDGCVQWQSSTAGAKTETLSQATVNGQSICVIDGLGNAATYPITITSGSGATIGGNASLTLSDNFFNVSLKWDNVVNWIVTDYYNGAKTIPQPNYVLSTSDPTSLVLISASGGFVTIQ